MPLSLTIPHTLLGRTFLGFPGFAFSGAGAQRGPWQVARTVSFHDIRQYRGKKYVIFIPPGCR